MRPFFHAPPIRTRALLALGLILAPSLLDGQEPTIEIDAPLLLESPQAGEERSLLERSAPVEELPAPAPSADTAEPIDPAADELLTALRAAHPWARFAPGAWRRTVTVTESFNGAGTLAARTTAERTERLVEVDRESYTLRTESTVTLAGRKTAAPTETRRLLLATDRPGAMTELAVSELEASSVRLGELAVPCRVWQVASTQPSAVESHTLYVASDSEPSVVRRERRVAIEGAAGASQTMRVLHLGLPIPYGDTLSSSWRAAIEAEHTNGARTERFVVASSDAPGGIHSESVADYEAGGRRTTWSHTRLIASGRTRSETVRSSGSPAPEGLEIRPRRLLRLLRRGEALPPSAADPSDL